MVVVRDVVGTLKLGGVRLNLPEFTRLISCSSKIYRSKSVGTTELEYSTKSGSISYILMAFFPPTLVRV